MDSAPREEKNLISKELIAELKRLVLYTKRKIDTDLLGNYKTAFRGQGITFREQREYLPGDEIRHINWKASARSDKTFVKTYEEDRRANVIILADVSNSTNIGKQRTKHRAILEYTALLSLLALRSGDSAGICLFAEDIHTYLPPSHQKSQLQRILLELMEDRTLAHTTNLGAACRFLQKQLRPNGFIFILSDFYSHDDYEEPLKHLSLKHDVVALCLQDEAEVNLPSCGIITFQDAEQGKYVTLDTSSKRSREALRSNFDVREQELERIFQRAGADSLFIEDDFIHSLTSLMHKRSRRSR